jgi:hypothetical protein
MANQKVRVSDRPDVVVVELIELGEACRGPIPRFRPITFPWIYRILASVTCLESTLNRYHEF